MSHWTIKRGKASTGDLFGELRSLLNHNKREVALVPKLWWILMCEHQDVEPMIQYVSDHLSGYRINDVDVMDIIAWYRGCAKALKTLIWESELYVDRGVQWDFIVQIMWQFLNEYDSSEVETTLTHMWENCGSRCCGSSYVPFITHYNNRIEVDYNPRRHRQSHGYDTEVFLNEYEDEDDNAETYDLYYFEGISDEYYNYAPKLNTFNGTFI